MAAPMLTRVIDCEDCCGSGRLSAYDPRVPERVCPYCCGTGDMEIELEPIEQEDLPT